MSAIGRVFVILNLFLAAAFLGWASTSLARGSEWKQKYEDEVRTHAATRAALDAEKSDLQVTLNTERTTKEQYREGRDAAKAEADRNAKDLEEAKRANDQLRADISKIQETLAGYNQTIAALTQSKDAAIAEARDLERQRDGAQDQSQEALVAQRDAEDALASALTQVADLERGLTTAMAESSKLTAQLEQAKASGFDVTMAAQPINGRVLQVSYDLQPGLVALNVGVDQGVQRGMVFQVYSNGIWKGQVRVENVQASMSSALITDMKKGETIAQGDSAATIL